MMNGYGEHMWGMGWGWIVGLIVICVIVWIIVKAIRQSNNPRQKSTLDILNERYVRGEISKDEFEEKKKGIS
jgi:putative membrane protein